MEESFHDKEYRGFRLRARCLSHPNCWLSSWQVGRAFKHETRGMFLTEEQSMLAAFKEAEAFTDGLIKNGTNPEDLA